MPNPVAANDLQPISGSLQTSRISYGVETAGKNYGQDYNGTTWYSDIPNNGQFYTIISDNYTANYYVSRSNSEGAYVEGGLPAVDEYSAPVFWVTPGTSSLDVITIVNGLPDRIGQTPFVSGAQALNWIASSSNYFAVGPDYYDQIDADQLALYLDASQIISYPTTASTWYDISGNTKNGTLVNGPTFNSNGWINFDGADDQVNILTVVLSGDFSITQIMNITTTANGPMPIGGGLFTNGTNYLGYVWFRNSANEVRFKVNGETGPDFSVLSSKWANKWISYTVTRNGNVGKLYINGIEEGSSTMSTNDFDVRSIGWGYSTTYLTTGSISKTLISNKALSTTEIFQNYYGGPIVTTDLYSMLDASNLVSYPKTGTTAYELVSGGAGNGALTNGPTFTTAFGGGWIMDGVDDYLRTSVDSNAITPTNSWTVNIWCSLNSYPTITGSPKEGILFGYALYGGLGIYAVSSTTGTVNVYGYFRSDSVVDIFGSYVWTLNTPTMFTLVHEAGVGCRFYVNGQLNYNYPGMTGGNWPGYMSLPFDLFSPQNGIYGGGANTYIYYPITTYSTQVYKEKALTAAEVLQNYNATK
jgi:hypothetical protein